MYFSYKPGDGEVEFHETADQAKDAAETTLGGHCDSYEEVTATDEDYEVTEEICWGKVMGKVIMGEKTKVVKDFKLKDVE